MNIMANIQNNLSVLFEGFNIMIFGMAGIFIVLLMLFGAIKVLLKLFPTKSE